MTNVYWLDQTAADLPASNDWLSESETARFDKLRFAKRRTDWRLGRWTAKLAIIACHNLPLDLQSLRAIEIHAASSGAPDVYLAGRPADFTISLSHRHGAAMCAVAPSSVALGCDLEIIEPHSNGFTTDYFTAEEQDFVARASPGDRSLLWALLWSAKESALKALREGLRLDTRSVEVTLGATADSTLPGASHEPNRWLPLHVRCINDQVFRGGWQNTGNLVRTMVSAPPSFPPIRLAPCPTNSHCHSTLSS